MRKGQFDPLSQCSKRSHIKDLFFEEFQVDQSDILAPDDIFSAYQNGSKY